MLLIERREGDYPMADWEEVDVELGSLKCGWCNGEVEIPFSMEFCCRSCWLSNRNYGSTKSEETRKKISEGHKSYWDLIPLEERSEKCNFPRGFGEDNPFYGKSHTEETKKKLSEQKTGDKNVFYGKKRPEHSETMKKLYENGSMDENKKKASKNFTEMNYRKHNDPGFRFRSGRGGFSYTGIYVSQKVGEVRYRSNWEKKAFEDLDQNPQVKKYTVEPFGIEYVYNGRMGNYYPDLLIEYIDNTLELVEIKPKTLIQDLKVRAKFKAACAYCKLFGIKFKVWHEDNWPTGAFDRSTGKPLSDRRQP